MTNSNLASFISSKKGLKENIISLLSNQWPLNAKEIYNIVKLELDKDVSYQAVHKSLNELEERKILEKNNKKYKLSTKWIDREIKSLQEVKNKYSGHVGEIKLNKRKTDQEYFFNTFSDLTVSIAELLKSNILSNKKKSFFVCTLKYGWFTLRIRFSDYNLLFQMVKKNPNSINIIRNVTPFGKWIHKQYIRLGNTRTAPIGTKFNIDGDLFVQGDYIIEISYSKQSERILEDIYKKMNGIEDCFKLFGLHNEPEIQAKVKITKNPSLAEYFYDAIEKAYNESIK